MPIRLRFSLGGLMACVFAIAVGLTEARQGGAAWFDGLFAAVAAWGAVGLAQQARDLRRYFHGDQTLNALQRSGVRFAISWRLAVVALLLGSFVLNQAEVTGRVSVLGRHDDSFHTGQLLRSAAFFLLLLTMATPGGIHKSPFSIARKLVQAAAILAGTILGLIVWCDEMLIPFLVHIACEGISGLTPARFLEPRIVPSLWSRSAPFFYASLTAAVLSALNFALVPKFAQESANRWRFYVIFFALSLSATYALAIWLATVGLRQASPYLYAGRPSHRTYIWVLASLVIGLTTAHLSVRWSASRWNDADISNSDWRHGRRYVHEGLFWRVLLAIAAGGSLCHEAAIMYQFNFGGRWIADLLAEVMTNPKSLLMLVLWLIAFGAVLARLAGRPVLPLQGVTALSAKKFTLVCCALVAAAVPALIAIAALSFALWLTPWYELPLLEK
jgi:hypothetical protein